MIPTDKEVAALIKKIQKTVHNESKKKKVNTNEVMVESLEDRNTNDMFNEMKKRPYTS